MALLSGCGRQSGTALVNLGFLREPVNKGLNVTSFEWKGLNGASLR